MSTEDHELPPFFLFVQVVFLGDEITAQLVLEWVEHLVVELPVSIHLRALYYLLVLLVRKRALIEPRCVF